MLCYAMRKIKSILDDRTVSVIYIEGLRSLK